MTDQYIGIDVGGTKIAAAELTNGTLEPQGLEPTADSSDAIVEQLAQVIDRLRRNGARAVGIGMPSVIEFATGRIRHSVNIPLADIPLRSLLTERAGLPVYVDNDANCAALAEAYEGDRLTCPHLVMFTIGTGVGGGLVLNGRVYRGATGAAPEMGHTIIGLDLAAGAPERTPFPQPGSLEALAAGRALDRLVHEAATAAPDSALGRRLAQDGEITGHDAVEAARRGDPDGTRLIRILGERLGVGVANAINMFDPLEIVIGGGVSTAGELLLEHVREAAARFTVPGVGTETRIRLARHGPRAGVLGAALMARHEYAEEEEGDGLSADR